MMRKLAKNSGACGPPAPLGDQNAMACQAQGSADPKRSDYDDGYGITANPMKAPLRQKPAAKHANMAEIYEKQERAQAAQIQKINQEMAGRLAKVQYAKAVDDLKHGEMHQQLLVLKARQEGAAVKAEAMESYCDLLKTWAEMNQDQGVQGTQSKLGEAETELQQLRAAISSMEDDASTLKGRLAKEQQNAEQKLSDAQHKCSELEQAVRRLEAEVHDLKAQISNGQRAQDEENEKKYKTAIQQVQRLKQALELAKEEKSSTGRTESEFKAECFASEQRHLAEMKGLEEEYALRLSRKEEQLAIARTDIEKLRERIDRMEDERAGKATEDGEMKKVRTELEGMILEVNRTKTAEQKTAKEAALKDEAFKEQTKVLHKALRDKEKLEFELQMVKTSEQALKCEDFGMEDRERIAIAAKAKEMEARIRLLQDEADSSFSKIQELEDELNKQKEASEQALRESSLDQRRLRAVLEQAEQLRAEKGTLRQLCEELDTKFRHLADGKGVDASAGTVERECLSKIFADLEMLKDENKVLQEKCAQLKEQNAHLKEQNAEIEKKDGQLKKQYAQLGKQNAELGKQNAQLERQNAQLQKQNVEREEQQEMKNRQENAGKKSSLRGNVRLDDFIPTQQLSSVKDPLGEDLPMAQGSAGDQIEQDPASCAGVDNLVTGSTKEDVMVENAVSNGRPKRAAAERGRRAAEAQAAALTPRRAGPAQPSAKKGGEEGEGDKEGWNALAANKRKTRAKGEAASEMVQKVEPKSTEPLSESQRLNQVDPSGRPPRSSIVHLGPKCSTSLSGSGFSPVSDAVGAAKQNAEAKIADAGNKRRKGSVPSQARGALPLGTPTMGSRRQAKTSVAGSSKSSLVGLFKQAFRVPK